MKTPNDYLNELKEKTESDYKTAKILGLNRSSLSMIRSRDQMSDETAVKIAQALEINEGEVLLAAAIARSKGEVKKAWLKISKRTGMAAGILLSIYTNIDTPLLEAIKECILC